MECTKYPLKILNTQQRITSFPRTKTTTTTATMTKKVKIKERKFKELSKCICFNVMGKRKQNGSILFIKASLLLLLLKP
ncbi:unnamed protein product [Schistosoma haematobium]|nr:unnamed protein product [Schistosoma haematobium]